MYSPGARGFPISEENRTSKSLKSITNRCENASLALIVKILSWRDKAAGRGGVLPPSCLVSAAAHYRSRTFLEDGSLAKWLSAFVRIYFEKKTEANQWVGVDAKRLIFAQSIRQIVGLENTSSIASAHPGRATRAMPSPSLMTIS